MKERLIELLTDSEIAYAQYLSEKCDKAIKGDITEQLFKKLEFYADYLLENGVIVPPCKVGQKLYTVYTRGINDKFIQESTVSKIVLDDWDGLRIIKKVVNERGCCFFYDVDQEQLNKTTFFSKEEAERHL